MQKVEEGMRVLGVLTVATARREELGGGGASSDQEHLPELRTTAAPRLNSTGNWELRARIGCNETFPAWIGAW